MIHYHGLPITPGVIAAKVLSGRHGFISFRHRTQFDIAVDVCQSFALDNGAFSAWRSGDPVQDWQPYYKWVEENKRRPNFDFAVIPDVIDGDEDANDMLMQEWPHEPHLSAVVWHMHESLDRLRSLVARWPRVAIGSSAEFATVGTTKWWLRMGSALDAVCDSRGHPMAKLHGLRMLNPAVFSKIPFASADSTNIARNIGIDKAWKGTYQGDKDWRALTLALRIEAANGANCWDTSL